MFLWASSWNCGPLTELPLTTLPCKYRVQEGHWWRMLLLFAFICWLFNSGGSDVQRKTVGQGSRGPVSAFAVPFPSKSHPVNAERSIQTFWYARPTEERVINEAINEGIVLMRKKYRGNLVLLILFSIMPSAQLLEDIFFLGLCVILRTDLALP